MRERGIFIPVAKGQEIERICPLSKKDTVDILAGRLCGCPSCKGIAEPVLQKNPLLRDIDYRKAQEMWQIVREEGRHD